MQDLYIGANLALSDYYLSVYGGYGPDSRCLIRSRSTSLDVWFCSENHLFVSGQKVELF